MLIWIVDDDVGFAFDAKRGLKAPGRKIEVFTDIDSFLEKAKKIKKEKLPLPDVVFMDVEMPERSGTDLYLEYLNQKDPLAGRFYFCSAMSYGRFTAFFESRNLNPPPFVQKSRFEQEREKIVEARRPDSGKKEAPAFVHPLARKKIGELEELKKRMGDLYYKGAFGNEEIAAFVKMAEKISALAVSLSLPRIVSAADALTAVLTAPSKPGIGPLRIKKEIRDFMQLLEKELSLRGT